MFVSAMWKNNALIDEVGGACKQPDPSGVSTLLLEWLSRQACAEPRYGSGFV